jgi:hypothetical protein
MACPKLWIVHWHALGTEPAGKLAFSQRARARGFKMIRRAAGFYCWIEVQ